MDRILITGGAGFLGSHLCARFLDDGHEVICLDNLITGSLENLKEFERNSRFTFLRKDVTEYLEIEGPLSAVLHFASAASPADYLKFPIQTLKAGALGAHRTLGLAKAKKAKYLLASTSEVYGDPEVHPQPESYWGHVNPVGPRGVYDEAKRFAEAMTMAYHRVHGVDARIARIFNTYGPRMRLQDGRALPNFVCQALKDEPITVYGDGSQTRSFCYVDDLVEGLIRLLASDLHDPVNLGNSQEVSLLAFARRVKAMSGSRSDIVFLDLPVDDPRVRQPDLRRARILLAWEPKISLDEGLKWTIPYFKRKLNII